jgi:1-acyl-sn-glycerol-3-phosphate acyltransferase
MWNPQTMELMPGFWPPRPGGAWNVALSPLRRYYLHQFYRISGVDVIGTEHFGPQSGIAPGDGVLIAPNHSHDADPHVMMHVGRRGVRRQLYFMAAWQVFLGHRGIDGWVMQRFGAFSVDREGCDRRAMRQAMDLLTGGQWLVVFPEGEIYHTNERLTPLREGVAFMAVTAERDLEKSKSPRQIHVVPAAIRYRYETDVLPEIDSVVASLESRLMVKPKAGFALHERIVALGEILLTIKEKEQLGKSLESNGDLPARLQRLMHHVLARHEDQQFQEVHDDDSVPLRVKQLRHHLLQQMCDDQATDETRRRAKDALDDLHLVLQLYSYPGDYVSTRPSPERMAETVEKFQEDLLGVAMVKPMGRRRATVKFGAPLDVKRHTTSRARTAANELTARLEGAIAELMRSM